MKLQTLKSFVTVVLLLLSACTTTQFAELPSLSGVLPPGDYLRELTVDGVTRSYLLHIPPQVSTNQPTPVVLAFHDAATNANFMVKMSGLNQKADEAGFVVAYPNGTGFGIFLTFNAGGLPDSATLGFPCDGEP